MNPDAPVCPRAWTMVTQGGEISSWLAPCGGWNCPKCIHGKVTAVTEQLILVTGTEMPKLWDILVPKRNADGVRRRARQLTGGSMRARLGEGGLYMIVAEPFRVLGNEFNGYGWEGFVLGFPDKLAELPRVRVDWTGSWSPEPERKRSSPHKFLRQGRSLKAIQDKYAEAGIDPSLGYIAGNVDEAVDRLSAVFDGPKIGYGGAVKLKRRSRSEAD